MVATIGVLAGATGRVVGKEVLTHDTAPDKGYRETPMFTTFIAPCAAPTEPTQ